MDLKKLLVDFRVLIDLSFGYAQALLQLAGLCLAQFHIMVEAAFARKERDLDGWTLHHAVYVHLLGLDFWVLLLLEREDRQQLLGFELPEVRMADGSLFGAGGILRLTLSEEAGSGSKRAVTSSVLILHEMVNLICEVLVLRAMCQQVRHILLSLCALQPLKQVKPAATVMKAGSVRTDGATVARAVERYTVIFEGASQGTRSGGHVEREILALFVATWETTPAHDVVLRNILVIFFDDRVPFLLSVMRHVNFFLFRCRWLRWEIR